MKRADSWTGARVGVLGLGRSGRAATRLLASAGARVYASDVADTAELRVRVPALAGPSVDIELGRHDPDELARCDLLVISPGIPPDAEIFGFAAVRARPIISELELAFDFLEAPVIAITGTNGKTTTTAWVGALLNQAGVRVGVGGNIGRALSELAAERRSYDWVVAEVSSFQLAHIDRFKPAIGALLNLCPDHLDRYADVRRYYADKARLFENGDENSRWVLNGEDAEVATMTEGRPGQRRIFRLGGPLQTGERGAYLAADGTITMRNARDVGLLDRRELRLLGLHNVANALAVVAVATYLSLGVDLIREALRNFAPLPHRLQPVAEIGGVLWINDSKATNVASAKVAIQAMERPLVMLLGGRPKGQSFAPLMPELEARARAVIVYGEAADQLAAELGERVRVVKEAADFATVVATARRLAEPGDAVLLAPACASFDMFRDYEERGTTFAELVGGRVA